MGASLNDPFRESSIGFSPINHPLHMLFTIIYMGDFINERYPEMDGWFID